MEELSYKEVCQKFGEKESSAGNIRERQLKRWQSRYDIKKTGRGKYIIYRELTPEEIQDIADRKNYSLYLQNMLLNYFAKNAVVQTYTYRDIREHLAMVNKHYFPVKYGNEKSEFEDTEDWFNIAEAHDKDVIRYALEQLQRKGLIVSYTPTYVLYKLVNISKDEKIITKRVATEEEGAKIQQIKLDYVKSQGYRNIQALYFFNIRQREECRIALEKYIRTLGFDVYARAFTVIRPYDLQRIVNYFAPKFNLLQVERYLTSKRFKSIPEDTHRQLTKELIKL